MRVYSVRALKGYYLGRWFGPTWTGKRPTIQSTVPADMRVIGLSNLRGYYRYLWRLGEWTFGAKYDPLGIPHEGVLNLENFADFHYLKIWPTYGRLWHAVGAATNPFPDLKVHRRAPGFPLYKEVSTAPKDVVVLRYEEELWYAQKVAFGKRGEWYLQMYRMLGPILMFERRGATKATKYQDEWDFGMTFWDVREVDGRFHLYLWGWADVVYVGMASHVMSTIYKIMPLRA